MEDLCAATALPPAFRCTGPSLPEPARFPGWNNTRFDDLMDLQATQLDQNQRIQTTYALERIVAEELPIDALVTPKRIALFDKTVMSSWYYTVGGGPIYPFLVNRLTFVGEKGNS